MYVWHELFDLKLWKLEEKRFKNKTSVICYVLSNGRRRGLNCAQTHEIRVDGGDYYDRTDQNFQKWHARCAMRAHHYIYLFLFLTSHF